MNLFVKFFCFLLLFSTFAHADVSIKKRIQHEKKRIERRYKSFYQHSKEKKQDLKRRRAGVDELKRQRAKKQQELERARLNYIEKKKSKKPSLTLQELEKKYLKKQEIEQERYEKNRKEYIALQKALQKLKSEARRVSLEAQLGLDKK